MNAALVLRGYAHQLSNKRRTFGVDWRRSIESQRKKLIEPLRAKYDRVDVILCTYEMERSLLDQLGKDYTPDIFVHVKEGRTQRQMALLALDQVIEAQSVLGDYDLVVMTRFDLEILETPWELPNFDPTKINFLWREWNERAWNDHHRVPDAIHMLPGSLVEGFRQGVATTPSEVCLHLIYWPVAKIVGEEKLNVMHREGYTDSNTDTMPNPVYKMVRVT